MRRRVVVVGVVALAVVGGVAAVRAWSRSAPAPVQPSAAIPRPVEVAVATARRSAVVSRVLAPGSVTSIRDAKIGSKISGRVDAVLVEEGAHVSAGQPLLRLDTSDLLAQQAQAEANAAAARAQLQKVIAGARPQERRQSADAVTQAKSALNSGQASLALADANVQRMRSLHGQGAVSQQDLDSAETQAQVAQAQVGQARAAYDSAAQGAALVQVGSRQEDVLQARAQLAQAQAQLAAVEVQIRDSTVSAPFAGMITQRNVQPGEVVSSSGGSSQSALFLLSQVDDVYVELVVPAQHRWELREGQTAAFAVDGLPGKTFEGRVEEIRPAADAASRSFGVKVRASNRQGSLRAGMFARGGIVTGVRPDVLQIPEPSVMTATSGTVVFVVRQGHAVRQTVVLGAHHDGLVDVISGLRDGDQVIVAGQDAVADGQPVTVRP